LETASGKVVASLKGPAEAQGAAFVRNGQQVVSWAKDRTLRVWDIASGKVVLTAELGADLMSEPDNVTVSPYGGLLVTSHRDQTVRIRDLATGKELHRFGTAPHSGTRSLAVSPDARFAAGGSFRGWVYLWRLPAVP